MKSNTIIAILAVFLTGMTIAVILLAFNLNNTRTELESSRQRIFRLQTTVSDLTAQAARLPVEERKNRQYTHELETVKKDLARAKSELSRKEQTWRDTLEKNRHSFEREKQDLNRQLAAARETGQTYEEKILELQQNLEEMQTRLAGARNKVSQAEKRAVSCEQQIAGVEKEKADLETRQGDLAQTETELQAAREAIAQLKKDVTAASEKISSLQARLNAALEELNATRQKFVSLKETNAACQTALQGEQARLADETARTAALSSALEKAETALEEKTGQVETLTLALGEARDKISAYKDRLQTVVEDKTRIQEEFQRFKQMYTSLVTDLEQQIKDREITVEQLREQITITFIDQILFSSGRASLNLKGEQALEKVGRILKKQAPDREILVKGHTDNLPIHKDFRDKYPTNWELSAHRAASVVRYLQHKTGLDPARLSAVGCSFYEPVAGNDTPEGRARNRRVEIIIAPGL